MGVKLGTDNNWAIKDGNLLAYNDASGRFFNKEFDFARGSRATYVGRDGLIKNSGEQPTNLVQNGDFSQLGSELIVNGDFSDGSTGWSTYTSGSSTVAFTDVATVNIVGGAFSYILQNKSYTSGKTYKVTAQIQGAIGSSGKQMRLQDNQSNLGGLFNVITLDETTQFLSVYFTANSNSNVIQISRHTGTGDYSFSIDNVSVKQVDPNDEWTLGTGWSIGEDVATCDGTNAVAIQQPLATVNTKLKKITFTVSNYVSGTVRFYSGAGADVLYEVSQNGTFTYYDYLLFNKIFIYSSSSFNGSVTNVSVQEIDTNTPRIDFTDDVNGHLLLEPQRSNLITYSELFSTWTSVNSAIASDTTDVISLDGTLNAQLLVSGGTGSVQGIYKNISFLNTTTYTMSVFAKKKEISFIQLQGGGAGWAGNTFANFDLQNGVVGSIGSGAISHFIENYGNGWYRCSFTATKTASGGNLSVDLINSATDGRDAVYNGNIGDGVYLFASQAEEGSYATSYIPTYNSAQTRLGETCNNSGSAQDFNSEEGVLYAEISGFENDLSNRRISLSDGTANNSIRIFYYNDGGTVFFRKYVGGVQTSIATIGSINQHELTKIAIKYNSTNFDIFANGVKISTNLDSNSFPTNTLNKIGFADGSGSGTPFYGNVKELQVFTTALTDAELIALTT
jgi:hypothetical protein